MSRASSGYSGLASLSVRRAETADDWDTIRGILTELGTWAEHPTKAIHTTLDPMTAYRSMCGSDYVWFVDGYLVYFAVGTPWYSTTPILSELLVVRVGEGGTLAGVANFLRSQARAAGARLVAVGTSWSKNDRALSRMYQAEGFTPQATLLISEP